MSCSCISWCATCPVLPDAVPKLNENLPLRFPQRYRCTADDLSNLVEMFGKPIFPQRKYLADETPLEESYDFGRLVTRIRFGRGSYFVVSRASCIPCSAHSMVHSSTSRQLLASGHPAQRDEARRCPREGRAWYVLG